MPVPHVTKTGELEAWPWHSDLSALDLNLEERDRVSALPWRGQFSPLTVERIIGALAQEGCKVLDPFVGSGTTLLEAAKLGYPSVGLDINPAAIAYAKCAELASVSKEQRLAQLQGARTSSTLLANEGEATIDLAHALALLALSEKSEDGPSKRIRALIDAMPEDAVATEARLGDARATGLPDASIGFVITSPPYINVFNYHQAGRPLTDGFGWPVLEAARSEIGSNRQNRANRFKTVIQYSIDMALALKEMARVMDPDATAVLVVGRESNVRGVPFYNSEIVAAIATEMNCFTERSKAERNFVGRFGGVIYEDILVLGGLSDADATVSAEEIGRAAGIAALSGAHGTLETVQDIAGALEDAENVQPSSLALGSKNE